MPNVNTSPSTTTPATVRAQLVTSAVIAAYIREISESQPRERANATHPSIADPEPIAAAIVPFALSPTARESLVLAAWYERQGPALGC
jgi:hypothetical protein